MIFLGIGYLAYTGFQSAATYYYTVDEAIAQASSIQGKTVRVNGHVAEIKTDGSSRLNLDFMMDGSEKSLPVVYRGAVPDTFAVGREVVVEGRLNTAGTFEAKSIMTKCPSKYSPDQ